MFVQIKSAALPLSGGNKSWQSGSVLAAVCREQQNRLTEHNTNGIVVSAIYVTDNKAHITEILYSRWFFRSFITFYD